ncbi:MAG TPA: MFS transporter [Candidatus Acidoferrum sp.]|nr:MFS transporter [Candidatus Acidoferrum sp.]
MSDHPPAQTSNAVPALSDTTTPADYQFAPDERPAFPGSPFSPHHSPKRRIAYAAIGIIIGISSTFGNALVNVNVPYLSGPLGLYVNEASWLPAIYVAMNATANLTMVKARAQFGIPTVVHGLLIAYALIGFSQILLPGFATAALTRALSGMTAGALVTLSIYYLLQVFPAKLRPLAVVIGVALPQMGTPLARLVPVEFLSANGWHGLHLLEPAVALFVLALVLSLPLPPSERSKAFQPLDLVTIALVVAAMLLVCGVLGQGRLMWWTDTPWLGWMLAAAVPLLFIAGVVEANRKKPLLQLGWMGSATILRFASVALLVRIVLAEQTYGSVGLLTSGGLNNDQLHTLFAFVLLAMVLGTLTAVVTLSERRLPWQVVFAALIIAAGAFIDSHATNVTRPPQLYLSQVLIGFGTTLFVGPALVYGVARVFAKGPDHLVSMAVLYSTTQNVGGLVGSALLGTYQTIQARAHAVSLSEHLIASDPHVVERLQGGAMALSGSLTDPLLRSAGGAALLAQSLRSEANILAYNDVFRAVAVLAVVSASYVAVHVLLSGLRRRSALTEV